MGSEAEVLSGLSLMSALVPLWPGEFPLAFGDERRRGTCQSATVTVMEETSRSPLWISTMGLLLCSFLQKEQILGAGHGGPL